LPRKFTLADKNTWLELFNKGKSEKLIAKENAKCDTRTVKKGIDEARRVKVAHMAQIELVKDALRGHQNDLLRMLEGIRTEIQVPPPDLTIPWELEKLSSPVPVAGLMVRYTLQEGPTASFQSDDSIMWDLLGEHLKRTRTWTMLSQWRKAFSEHILARVLLQRKAAMLLKEKTGLELFDIPQEKGSYLISAYAMPLLYDAALHTALGINNSKDLEPEIMVHLENGEVFYRYSNMPIAHVPGAEEECRQQIFEALSELKASAETKEVADTYPKVVDLTDKTRRSVEEMTLVGLIPGQCRACRSLGL
jgi:hypothetical protein